MSVPTSSTTSTSTSTSTSATRPSFIPGVLAIFDFDHSLIADNSDTWIFEQLEPSLITLLKEWYAEGQKQKLEERGWTDLMDHGMFQLHSRGHRAEHIKKAFSTIPMHQGMIATVRALHAANIEMIIISDANSLFIDLILEAYGIRDCFLTSNIYTNPAHYDDEGRMRVDYYHNRRTDRQLPVNDTEGVRRTILSHASTHTCPRCPRNLCKGLLVDEILAHRHGLRHEVEAKREIACIYLGDGGGDFCPATRLSASSWVLAKRDFPLAKMLKEHADQVRATVHEWNTGEDAHVLYKQFIQKYATSPSTCASTSTPTLTSSSTSTSAATSCS